MDVRTEAAVAVDLRNRARSKPAGAWFDAAAADAACRFFPTYLRHTEGEWAGQPFVLAPWQEEIVREVFGWKRADGSRVYRHIWLEVPRKNGKSEFAAGLAILLLVADGEMGAQIYCTGASGDQARLVFDKARKMVGMSEELSRCLEVLKPSITCPDLMYASLKPLSALPVGKQGFSPSGRISDEIHEYPDGELVEAIHEGTGARRQPLELDITTAGQRDTYAWEQHQYALDVIEGRIEDEELFVAIYAAGEDDDWQDEATWERANPALDITVKRSFLQAECRKARHIPRLQNRFRRFYLNQWVEQATRWLPMEFWNVCTAAPSPEAVKAFLADPDLEPALIARVEGAAAYDRQLWKALPARLGGRSCFGGVDLAVVNDLSALAWYFPPERGGIATFLWRFWLPEASLKAKGELERKRLQRFAEEGALSLTPGNVTDYEFIKTAILADAARFGVKKLFFDRASQGVPVATALLNDHGLPVEFYGQGMLSMSAPSKEFERRVLGLLFEHGNNPVAQWMARNVAVFTDAHDNLKPVKDKSAGKIDGIIAAIMGLAAGMAESGQGRSFWQTMGAAEAR